MTELAEIENPPMVDVSAAVLARVDNTGTAVSLLPVPQMQEALAEYDVRRKAFRRWLLSQLVEGVHYGVPPGCEPKRNHRGEPIDFRGNVIPPEQWQFKPSLYKAGADFCCDLLMFDPAFEPDLDTWKMLGSKEGTVVIRCRLISRGDSPFFPGRGKGDVLGEGRGAADVGTKKRDANGAVKLAQKCAKVDAVINTLGISDLFTQDMDDKLPVQRDTPDPDPESPVVPTREQRQKKSDTGAPDVSVKLSALTAAWKKKNAKGTVSDFQQWAKGILKTNSDLVHTSDWSLDAVEFCMEAV